MNPEEFRQQLVQKGIELSDEQMAQFQLYYELLVSWNEKMNLTAITEKNEVYLKHFYDSLSLAFYVSLSGELTLCDVGAGAGFPSIPLKIAFPNIKVTIVDSLNKRITFLNEVANQLNLSGVTAVHGRAEEVGQNKAYRGQFDLVTARAVARLSVLSEYCLPLVKKDGRFVAMKAQAAAEELEAGKKAIATLGGKVQENFAFDLSEEAGQRHIIIIEKTKETPNAYPRKAGKPSKNPIE